MDAIGGFTTEQAIKGLKMAAGAGMAKTKIVCTYISDFKKRVNPREYVSPPLAERVIYEGWIVSENADVILLSLRVNHAERLYESIVVIPTNTIVVIKRVDRKYFKEV